MLYANPGSSRMPELPDNVPATRPGAGSTMREALQEWPHGAVLHDPKCGFEWTPARFSSDTWRAEGAYLGEDTGGRGTVVFVRAGNQEWGYPSLSARRISRPVFRGQVCLDRQGPDALVSRMAFAAPPERARIAGAGASGGGLLA